MLNNAKINKKSLLYIGIIIIILLLVLVGLFYYLSTQQLFLKSSVATPQNSEITNKSVTESLSVPSQQKATVVPQSDILKSLSAPATSAPSKMDLSFPLANKKNTAASKTDILKSLSTPSKK